MIYIPLKLDKNSDRHRASQGHIQIYIPLKLDKNALNATHIANIQKFTFLLS